MQNAECRNDYALSMKDLSLIQHVSKLREAGVASLKIEGRMKRPEYVAAVVTACREKRDNGVTDIELLRNVFSRSGFTDGYFTGEYRDFKAMQGVRTKEDVTAGIEAVKKIKYDSVYKRYKIDFHVTVKAGEPIVCTASVNDINVTVSGNVPETAVRNEITADSIKAQMAKLGGTVFTAGEITCEIECDTDSGLAVSLSEINRLRREAADGISEMIVRQNEKRYSINSDIGIGSDRV